MRIGKVKSMPYPATPHATVRQILNGPNTKEKLSEFEGRRDKDRTTAKNHLLDIANFIAIRASQYKSVLVVTQKEFEDSLKSIGLSGNVEIAHFNSTRGIDRWRGVEYVLVIGRTLPGPEAAEALAEALTGRPATAHPRPWYVGGRHPDASTEAARWSVCEAELVQVIGRGRAINRSTDNPVLIEVLNDVPLPIPVNETVAWAVPSRLDVMTSRGVILENNADRARCFPDLWRNEQQAKRDAERTGTFSYKASLYIGVCTRPRLTVRYQPPGRGQRSRTAQFDTTLIPAPESWLASRLGALAMFEIVAATTTEDTTSRSDGEPTMALPESAGS